MVDYERLRPNERVWDLASIRELLGRPGAAVPPRPAVQVAGSKGKGTTAAFLEALVAAGGRGRLSAGTYSSPHVATLRERIRVAGRMVSEADLRRLLENILAAAGASPPTFFEAMTIAAVECFAQSQVDLAIYEVGLGGRLDATTAIPVDAAIVTRIELEHTEVLGDTIAAIAGEKAHVIRPGGLGITGADGSALPVIRRHADDVGAELLVLGKGADIELHDIVLDADQARGVLRLPDGGRHPFCLPGANAFELPALALAAATLQRVLPDLPLALDPAPRPWLPCRFESFAEPDGQTLVLDGAHTEDSLRAVAAECGRRFPGKRLAVLTAFAAGKRWREGLSALLPMVDVFVVTELSGTPGEPPANLADWLVEQGAECELMTELRDAVQRLRAHDGPRLVVGSFYLAGAVRQLVAPG
ncbi:MAG: folylpolyglutamate synthase/dihydrofolate synthase family protein [Planctomycetota bacterium]